MLVAILQSHIDIVLSVRHHELVQWFQTDVDVPVLKKLIVEAFLGEVGIQSQQVAVLFGRIGK